MSVRQRSKFMTELLVRFNHLFHSENKDLVDLKQFENFIDEVDQKIDNLQFEKSQSETALNIGMEEMQKVWRLINERENLIKSLLDSSDDVIITLNEFFEIIEFNHKAEKFFDYSKIEVQGKSIFNLIKDGTVLNDLNQIKLNNKFNFGINKEGILVINDNKSYPVSSSIHFVVCDHASFYHLYIRDLTQIKLAEQELEKSRAQVAFSSKLSSLGEMAGGIAHEINTPLAIIQMRADQLLDGAKEEDIDREFFQKALNSIDVTVKRIAKIVRSLKSFSRDGSKDPLVPTSVNSIIEEILSLCREKLYIHDVKLHFSPAQDYTIDCRSSEIGQVILNLISNSYDAVENLEKPWIKIEPKEENNYLILTVTDAGNGIPLKIQEKMMNPFFTTKETGKGTGLGLSISKSIIESHKGSISINNDSVNTQFVIKLPLSSSKSE